MRLLTSNPMFVRFNDKITSYDILNDPFDEDSFYEDECQDMARQNRHATLRAKHLAKQLITEDLIITC